MFGIGTPELLVILVLALVVVGPQRLPELGRTLGRALREFRKVQDEVQSMVKSGIGDDLDDVKKELRGTADELKRTSQEITGGVKEATNVKPLLPSAKRGAFRTRPPGSRSGDRTASGASATDPPPEQGPSSAQSDTGSDIGAAPAPDTGSASSD